ncbi:MAG: hypothetical protein AAGC60_26120 [Acidobacteriota bacterium]
MQARWTIGLALVALLSAAPAAAQETVRGFFEGPVNGDNAGTGAIGMTGWALADSGVQRVEILVDGEIVGTSIFGQNRPDVANQFPFFPDSAGAGFAYQLNSTDFPNGPHMVSARVVTNLGNRIDISPPRQIFFSNNISILRPFGEITFPRRNADLFGTCVRSNPILFSPITGWALDLGVEIGDTGIGYVELLIDGAEIFEIDPRDPLGQTPLYFNSRSGCYFDGAKGGLTNCYGLPRLNVERNFPFALDAPTAGFRFVVDVGFQIVGRAVTEGAHLLTIRAGDVGSQAENIDEIPVNFFCIESRPNQGAIGFIESPREGDLFDGDIVFQGWAVDFEGVADVNLYIDGVFIGSAAFGVDTRPGVALRFMGYPDANAPVWRLTFDSTVLSNAVHQVQVFVVDDLGFESLIGERSFTVFNP